MQLEFTRYSTIVYFIHVYFCEETDSPTVCTCNVHGNVHGASHFTDVLSQPPNCLLRKFQPTHAANYCANTIISHNTQLSASRYRTTRNSFWVNWDNVGRTKASTFRSGCKRIRNCVSYKRESCSDGEGEWNVEGKRNRDGREKDTQANMQANTHARSPYSMSYTPPVTDGIITIQVVRAICTTSMSNEFSNGKALQNNSSSLIFTNTIGYVILPKPQFLSREGIFLYSRCCRFDLLFSPCWLNLSLLWPH